MRSLVCMLTKNRFPHLIQTKAYGYEPAFKFTDAEIAAIAAAEGELELLGW